MKVLKGVRAVSRWFLLKSGRELFSGEKDFFFLFLGKKKEMSLMETSQEKDLEFICFGHKARY